MNKTAKNLTEKQVKNVEDYCQMIWNDPELARTKTTFCSKLAWTIGNEYQDLDTGMQEVWVVYWKTTVDILYHRPKRDMKQMIEATCAKCGTVKTIKCSGCDSTGIMSNEKCLICHGDGYTKIDPDMTCGCGATATLSLQ